MCALQSCDVSAVSTAVLSVSASRLQLVCVGDSLTQRSQQPDGWLTLLSHFYQRRLDGINRGFSGYNSDWLLALVRQQRSADPSKSNVWRLSEQPNVRSLYVLLIGANDAVLPPVSSNKQHVPLQRFQDNVRRATNQARSYQTAAHDTPRQACLTQPIALCSVSAVLQRVRLCESGGRHSAVA